MRYGSNVLKSCVVLLSQIAWPRYLYPACCVHTTTTIILYFVYRREVDRGTYSDHQTCRLAILRQKYLLDIAVFLTILREQNSIESFIFIEIMLPMNVDAEESEIFF